MNTALSILIAIVLIFGGIGTLIRKLRLASDRHKRDMRFIGLGKRRRKRK